MTKSRSALEQQVDCALQPSHNALVAVAQLMEPRQHQYAEDFGILERFAMADLLLVIHRDLNRQIRSLKKTLRKST